MSDSEHSTITYTSVSEDDLYMGSPGVEVPIYEGPPSPDYVPGPEEPEQAPPSPIYIPFVPEPVYPEFLPVDDEVFPAEEQPLPAADSPTHQSPGYIPESDPEEDLEEDDEEDPEEDPADYPADRGDDDDEHLAPAEPAAVAYSADQDPYIAYRATARMSIRTQAPTPFLSEEVAERIPCPPLPIPPPPPNGPTYVEGSLGSRAAGIRQRDALPSPIHETEMPEICLPLRKRPRRTTPGPGYEVGESSAAGTARQVRPATAGADLYGFTDMLDAAPGRQTTRELGYGITDTWDDLVGAIQEIAPTTLEGVNQRSRVNRMDRDRPIQDALALLMDEEARLSRAAWARSMDACDQVHSEGISLRTTVMAQQSEITELQAADRRRQASQSNQRIPVAVLNWFLIAATVQSVNIMGYFPASTRLMFPEETDKIERYVGGMPDLIYSSVVASKPKTMQEAIEMATELMDRRINTLAERQTENKRKFEDAPRNNQNQQPNKRQNTGRAYAAGNGDKKSYEGTKPLCPKCNFNHYGPCIPKCTNCKKLGHLAKDCRSRPATANNNNRNNNNNNNRNNNNPRAQGGGRKDCPQRMKKKQGKWYTGVARLMQWSCRARPRHQPLDGTFLLNNRCASILFDTGADRSFVSTQFSTLINIAPTTLDHGYNVELADGRIIWVNTVLLGCTLNFLNHPFHVDLMPVEMGTYDVIIGMDWLTKYQAVIDCAKKIVRIPFGSEILIFHGDGSRNKRGTRLNIISCTKAQKYLLQGCHIFLAHITVKETGDQSKKKQLQDVPIVKNFPEVFPEDLPGLPATRQMEFTSNNYLVACHQSTGLTAKRASGRMKMQYVWVYKQEAAYPVIDEVASDCVVLSARRLAVLARSVSGCEEAIASILPMLARAEGIMGAELIQGWGRNGLAFVYCYTGYGERFRCCTAVMAWCTRRDVALSRCIIIEGASARTWKWARARCARRQELEPTKSLNAGERRRTLRDPEDLLQCNQILREPSVRWQRYSSKDGVNHSKGTTVDVYIREDSTVRSGHDHQMDLLVELTVGSVMVLSMRVVDSFSGFQDIRGSLRL
ncbi:putative reverse transcriptase domain-containing protein [Tanacetum coccineum]|uniref:Reverse transcriptase domain-containing protein n=1 Tax=Tanacetum coccineum TaxID=301880 RepID=A0ABQ5HIP9_9ASTR